MLTTALVQARGVLIPLLHSMVLTNAHPHRELVESVELLLTAGVNIDAGFTDPNGDQHTALMCAAERRCCTTVLSALIHAGADPCAQPAPKGATALHKAAQIGSAESCKLLLTRADTLLEVKDVYGLTALSYAAMNGHLDTVQLLAQNGADVNARHNRSRTPLFWASLHQHVDVLARLLTAGADVNAVDCDGTCVLGAAVQSGSAAVVQLLLNNGADINSLGNSGQIPLLAAAHGGHVSIVKLLLQRGCSITTVDNKGNTVLMVAVLGARKAAAEWLIQHGVAVNATNINGCTALHTACTEHSGDDAAMIELLLANGADLHKCNTQQQTALVVAVLSGKLQCTKALIAAGADVNHLSSVGCSSLHMAINCQHAALVQLLLDNGATAAMNSVILLNTLEDCQHGMTALMMCTTTDTLKLLLAAGADVHIRNEVGDTCLHTAARHNYKAPVLCLLIKAGVDLHAVDSEGKTAAQLAHDVGNTLIEQLLNRAAQQQGH
jgi:uncharacterized protein